MRRAFDLGITLFDEADTYGNGLSEELIAEALGAQRDRIVIATKMLLFSNRKGDIFEELDIHIAFASGFVNLYEFSNFTGRFAVRHIVSPFENLLIISNLGRVSGSSLLSALCTIDCKELNSMKRMVTKKTGSGCMDDLSIAVVVFEGAEEQDVVGPYEMFWWMSLFQDLPPDRPIGESDFADAFYPEDGSPPKVFTVAPTTDTYRMTSRMRFIPDFSYDNAPAANMIVAPGGRGARDIPALQKNGTIDYIKKVASAPGCKYVMSVCTGAFLLGAAGLLV